MLPTIYPNQHLPYKVKQVIKHLFHVQQPLKGKKIFTLSSHIFYWLFKYFIIFLLRIYIHLSIMNRFNAWDRSRSPATEQHLKDNPASINPYKVYIAYTYLLYIIILLLSIMIHKYMMKIYKLTITIDIS